MRFSYLFSFIALALGLPLAGTTNEPRAAASKPEGHLPQAQAASAR